MNRIDPDNVVIRAPRRRERKAIIETTRTVFERYHEPGTWAHFCRRGYLDGSCYDWDTSRIAVADGRIVGHIGIWGHTRLVGRAKVTSGGLGTVCTHPDVRGTGLGRILMEAVLDSMKECGYDTSFMAGIPDFYARFGWVPAWGRPRIEIPVGSLPEPALSCRLRRASLLRMIRAEGSVGRIYRREQADVVGAAVRPLFTKDHRGWRFHEMLTSSDRLCGYIAHETKTITDVRTLVVYELGGFGSTQGRRRLLGALRELAAAQRCTSVHLPYGPDHPLAAQLRTLKCAFIVDHHGTGGDLVRIINLPSTLRKMAGELTARLARSPMARRSGSLAIVLPDQQATLVVRRGCVSARSGAVAGAARVGRNWNTARLLIGSETPAAVIDTGDLKCPASARPWVEALFPKQRHQYLRADAY